MKLVTPLDSSGPVYRLGIVTYSGHIHVQQSAIDTCLTMDEVTRGQNSNLSRMSKPETFEWYTRANFWLQ
jgi:hypothetical protein